MIMWTMLPILCVPLLVMGVMWSMHRDTFTLKEFLLLEAVMIVVVFAGFQWARYTSISDTEVWNGRLIAKEEGRQNCCHCRMVCDARNQKGTCTRSHRTCDHLMDHWWRLDVSTGDVLKKDCSGSSVPPDWWSRATIGEPASIPHTYSNYLLADPDSILLQHAVDEDRPSTAPRYPSVYDRYKIDRFIPGDTDAPANDWNNALNEINADLGKSKQVNIMMVATRHASPNYADTVEVEWLFGKKNDLIFVVGAPDGDTIEWTRIVTISNVDMLEITARDQMPGMKLSDVEGTSAYVRSIVTSTFHRTPMSTYEYLWAAARPTPLALFLLYLVAIIGSVVGSFIMISRDVFGDEHRRNHHW